jgi:hypothetical protein
MVERVGDEFDALMISTTKYGFFVELEDLFIEGLVPIDVLPGDRYFYQENVPQNRRPAYPPDIFHRRPPARGPRPRGRTRAPHAVLDRRAGRGAAPPHEAGNGVTAIL